MVVRRESGAWGNGVVGREQSLLRGAQGGRVGGWGKAVVQLWLLTLSLSLAEQEQVCQEDTNTGHCYLVLGSGGF